VRFRRDTATNIFESFETTASGEDDLGSVPSKWRVAAAEIWKVDYGYDELGNLQSRGPRRPLAPSSDYG